MGGWELISWSLVSAQSLDASPCLAASSQPAPAPLSLPVAPHLPQIPSCPPGSATQPPPCPVHRLRAQGERGGDWGRGEKASVLSLRFHPMLAPAHGCPYQQARDRAAPPPSHRAGGAEPVLQPAQDAGSGSSGISLPGLAWSRRWATCQAPCSSGDTLQPLPSTPKATPASELPASQACRAGQMKSFKTSGKGKPRGREKRRPGVQGSRKKSHR